MTGDRKVLIVDDSPAVRAKLSKRFRALGFSKAVEASDGLEAISLLDSESFDLISLDVIMPVMHGIECLQLIRANHPSIPVLLLTCLVAEPNATQALTKHADTYTAIASKYTLDETFDSAVRQMTSLLGSTEPSKAKAG